MQSERIQQLRQQNRKSANAIAFLIAAIAAMLVYGFWQVSLPAFLLSAVFLVLTIMESREYRKSYSLELQSLKTIDHEEIS